ncbi:hypothetical protein ACFLZ9_01960 [Patescibacteria group bacterium]
MNYFKNKASILLVLSVLFFIITCTFHVANKKRIAHAFMGGSVGGRIVTAFPTPPPTPTGPCIGFPCACSATYTTIITPAGGACMMLCPPLVNIPNTGLPISSASTGSQLLGFWTNCIGVAVSANWGTGF